MCDDQQVRMRCMPVIHGVTRVPRPPITYKGRVGRRIKHSSVPASSQSSAIRVQCMSVNVIARGFDMSVCGMSARNHVLRGGFLRLLVHLAAVHYAVDPRLKLGAPS